MTTLLDTIGNTPLVKLQNINKNSLVEIWAKLEFFNPGGSIKDRMVKHIIEDAEQKGLILPGGTIVENTSGNTGAAVAMIAAIKGYKAILTMPDKVSREKTKCFKRLWRGNCGDPDFRVSRLAGTLREFGKKNRGKNTQQF